MSSSKLSTLASTASFAVLASLLLASGTQAQTAQSDPKADPKAEVKTEAKKADEETTTVTVTGAKAQNRIDRQVYDNTKNADAAVGTAGDTLNKVPGVTVDANGNVALRGNTNVQVYVDGKPSAMMSGDNRAGAIQAMSGGDIASVEVMNQPGAQFSSEGSGGIINLVMKKNRRPGGYGSANVAVGDGRYNGGVSGSYTAGKVSVNGGINYREDGGTGKQTRRQRALDANGNTTSRTESNTLGSAKFKNLGVNAGVDFNLDDTNTLSAAVSYSKRDVTITGAGDNATYNAAGVATRKYTNFLRAESPGQDQSLALTWSHMGKLAGETLKADLRISRSTGENVTTNAFSYTLPSVSTATDRKTSARDLSSAVFSLDYNRPIGTDQLTTGIQITRDDSDVRNESTGTGADGLGNALLTNAFQYKQTLAAAYMTYQKPFGEKWVVLGGLRMENLDLDTYLVNTGTYTNINYTKYSPSLFATYLISDTAKLRFSYARRLQRPSPQSLNAALTYNDPTNVTQGNPNLKPQETDSFELGYEVAKGKINYQIRGYYRDNQNVITQTSRFLTGNVLLTTQENGGESQAGGIEFNFNGQITPKLNLTLGGDVAHTELTTPSTGSQEADSLNGRVNFTYTLTPKDSFQVFFFSRGKTLTGQGYTEPFGMGNFTYVRKLTPKASLTLTVRDPLNTGKSVTYTQTKTVYSESSRSQQASVIYLGLRYNFGGAAPANANQPQMRIMGGPGGQGGGPRPGGF
ncbi:outer membrane beta-barrel family protein [Asticcacaulis sp. BYS171W]|uniref:Outer membrane beta-barrel family protein n=1 Tax=Asticcacaulis aquaticus TaxID=2984212 RepID=A0ABT5HVS7_9CAUL|nr:outer membrane beta-barrel family protein [Asticcacaulis aquaticus]MDC7684038.1 outer membrane beta-barrel family protein [Asticcacaulis aquaticus]